MAKLQSKTLESDISDFMIFDGNNIKDIMEFMGMQNNTYDYLHTQSTDYLHIHQQEGILRLAVGDYVIIDSTGYIQILSANNVFNFYKGYLK